MIRAFIVKLDVETGTSLTDMSLDVEDALNNAGLPVESVVPWKGHGIMTEQPAPITPIGPIQPPPTIK